MRTRHAIRAILFLVGLAIGWVVLLLTNSLIVAVLAQYLFSGWPAVRNGFWLFNRDDYAGRAWICLFFAFAVAAWNAAASSAASVLILAFTQGAQPPANQLSMILVSLLLSVAFCLLLGFIAVAVALAFRVKVWSHPDVRLDLYVEPHLSAKNAHEETRLNRAFPVLAATVVAPIPIISTMLLITHIALHPNNPTGAVMLFLLGCMFLGPLISIPIYIWLSRRILAKKPAECWPPSNLEH